VVTCWECETETARPMTARLRLAEGAFSILMLCPACHRKLAREVTTAAVSFQAMHPACGRPGQNAGG